LHTINFISLIISSIVLRKLRLFITGATNYSGKYLQQEKMIITNLACSFLPCNKQGVCFTCGLYGSQALYKNRLPEKIPQFMQLSG